MRIEISSMIGLFCLIGCLYQIYDITEFYLQFKVRRDVAYEYPNNIEIPAIDIMVPMFMAMNYSKLYYDFDEKTHSICAKLHEQYKEGNYTIDDPQQRCEETIYYSLLELDPIVLSLNLSLNITVRQVDEASIDLRQQVWYPGVISFGFLTDRHCNLTRYYNGVAIFLRIFCLNGTEPFSVNRDYITRNQGYILSLRLSFGLYFGIRLSDPTDLPVCERSKYFMITREPGSFPFALLSFTKTVMSSLEYPYETKCRYYKKAESISKCMTEYSLGQSPPYLFKTSTYAWGEHPSHLGFNPFKGEIKVQDTELDAFRKCKQQAVDTECEKTSYLVEGKIMTQVPGSLGMLILEPSLKPNIYLSVHPVLPWSEYVIFIGSILGIWFGISVHDHGFKILACITTRFLKFKCKRKNKGSNEMFISHWHGAIKSYLQRSC